MGQFKPMVKMMTDEPSVILKLKKGGKVHHKAHKEHEEHHGHKAMHHMHHDEAEHGHSPKKPSMAHRRKAMNPNFKKGGAVAHEEHEIHKLEKELKHHEHEKASKAHHGLKKGGKVHHKASGGAIDRDETKTTIKGNAKKFEKTKVVDGSKHDKHHGTGDIKEGKAGSYKTGGAIPSDTHEKKNVGKSKMHSTIEGNEHDYLETEMHSAKKDKAHGTKGIKETNAGGFKRGGRMHHKATGGAIPAATEKSKREGHLKQGTVEGGDWEDRPADTSTAGKKNGKTGGVKEGNAGGFKHGGHASKKHYATGGNVIDDGKAVKMPRHFVSKPVANSLQSGTFKKGGKVQHHMDGGLQFAPGQNMRDVSPQDVADAKQRYRDTLAYQDASRIVPRSAGAGRGFVNPPLVRKHGGRAKK